MGGSRYFAGRCSLSNVSCRAPNRSSSAPDQWQTSSAIARIFAIRDWELGVSLFTWVALRTSESVSLGVLKKDARPSDIAPTLACRLEESSSKLPELFDCTEGSVSIGVGVSSLSCSSTVANESGSLPNFFPYCDFMRESICCSPRNSR
jgi:hypothetical protein